MRTLFAASCLTPFVLCLGARPALAQTTVTGTVSGNYRTSTSGALTVDSAATLTAPAGAALTLDSDSSITANGTVATHNVDNSAAIEAQTGHSGTVTNAGTLTVDEDYTPTDTDGDGDLDGPFAIGTGRYGIHVTGAGILTGGLTSSGAITVEGNNSAGIAIDGTLAGSMTSSGAITVTGNNSYGLHLQNVTGDVVVTGAVGTLGGGSSGVLIEGNVGGTVTLQSAITATGYRSTTRGTTAVALLDADDLLQGGPAAQIAGDVAGGVSVATGTTSTGALTSDGAAAGLLIGSSSRSVSLGLVSGTSYGLSVAGTISGFGIYDGVKGTGLQIGGLGQSVSIAGGVSIAGTVSSTSYDTDATAIRIGSGASVPTLVVSGVVASTGGANSTRTSAVAIDAGAVLPTFTNSGTITATSASTAGLATTIIDASGTLTSLTNTATIMAADATATAPSQLVAIDLSANTSGVAITQQLTSATATNTPTITGAILTGSGNDVLTLSAGKINGAISLGAGDDSVALSGSSNLTGAIDFGAGANTLTLDGTSVFTGSLSQTGTLAVAVNGGTLAVTSSGTVALSSLSVGSSGTILVNLDTVSGAHTLYAVSGSASFVAGAKVKVAFSALPTLASSYQIVSAATIGGASNLALVTDALPYLLTAGLSTTTTGINLDLRRKTIGELGLNRAQGSAYDALFTAISGNAALTKSFIALTGQAAFTRAYSSMLPDHGGGLFLAAREGSDAMARAEQDASAPRTTVGDVTMWLQEFGARGTKSLGDSEATQTVMIGGGGGAELGLAGAGSVGLSLGAIYDEAKDRLNSNGAHGYQYQLAGYWRGHWGGLTAHARVSGALMHFGSKRVYGDDSLTIANKASWNGNFLTAGGGLAYEQALSKRFYVRPAVAFDHYRLSEKAHDETGGGTAFDLSIDARHSDASIGTAQMALGARFGDPAALAFRLEAEGGYRKTVAGKLGDTTARFAGGEDFTLAADALKGGPQARLRLSGGGDGFTVFGEVAADRMQQETSYVARAGFRLAL